MRATIGVMRFHRISVAATAFLVVLAIGATLSAQTPSFTFTTVGDLGGTVNTDGVLNGIAASGADLHLTLGDLSYGSYAPETAWCSYVHGKVGATFPFELGAGNHDMDGSSQGHINTFAQCLPDRIGNLSGVYAKQYYFDYQNLARVIYISPNLNLDGESYVYTVGSARYTWLVSAIDGARAANLPWVIVAMHKNCISTGVKSCEIGTDLFNLMVSKKVDLVLQGHDHNYQRAKQLALNASCAAIVPNTYNANCVHDDGADMQYPKGGGTVLMIVGTGGVSIYPSNHLDSEAGYFARIVHPYNEVARYGFLQVNVTSTQLSAQFVGTSSNSTFTDSFVIGGSPPPTAAPSPTPNATTLIAKNSAWKYLDNGSDQGTAWRALAFDDSAWVSGNGQLGYGDGDEGTVVSYGPNANNKYVTTYFRKTFTVANPASISALTLKLVRDDGAVVYLNGTQVASSNMPSSFAYNTYASTVVGGADESAYFTFTLTPALLERAELLHDANVLAVEIHQANATSSDLSFDAELVATNMPTTTTLAAFTAHALDAARVRVKWTTANESSVIGFNVWRKQRAQGTFEKINPALISAKKQGQLLGARYRFTDRRVTTRKTYRYKLEILYADDSVQWSEPIKVKVP